MTQPVIYTDYDYDTLLIQLQNRLALESTWRDMGQSATGSMIMQLFAAVGTLVLYYIERRAEESYLPTAQNYSSVVNLVRLLNYIPVRNVSAQGTLRFTVSPSPTYMVFVPKWTIVQTAGAVNYLTGEDAVIMPGQTQVDVASLQGLLKTITYTSTGAENQEYIINDTTIEQSNLIITIDGVVWTRVSSFINSINTSTDYVIKPQLDGTVSIVFGDGVFGLKPPIGSSIVVQYIQSIGNAGNNYSLGSITTLISSIYDQNGTLQTPTVTNTTVFSGGADAETIEEIRTNAPAVFATGDRAVTRSDFIAIMNAYPGIADSNAWGENEEDNPDYDMYNQAKLVVILNDWVLPDAGFKSLLSDFLYTKSLMTIRLSYVDPVILYVIPTLIIKVLQGFSLSFTQSLVETAIDGEFTLGDTTKLGLAKRQSDLIAAMEAISGIDYVHLTYKIRSPLLVGYSSTHEWGNTVDALPLLPGAVEIYIDNTKVGVDDGEGVFTTVVGSAYTVTGTVDYETGRVLVDFNPNLSDSSLNDPWIRYQQDEDGDIVPTKDQICKYLFSDYTTISFSS